jgi:hypothetical protein
MPYNKQQGKGLKNDKDSKKRISKAAKGKQKTSGVNRKGIGKSGFGKSALRGCRRSSAYQNAVGRNPLFPEGRI